MEVLIVISFAVSLPILASTRHKFFGIIASITISFLVWFGLQFGGGHFLVTWRGEEFFLFSLGLSTICAAASWFVIAAVQHLRRRFQSPKTE